MKQAARFMGIFIIVVIAYTAIAFPLVYSMEVLSDDGKVILSIIMVIVFCGLVARDLFKLTGKD